MSPMSSDPQPDDPDAGETAACGPLDAVEPGIDDLLNVLMRSMQVMRRRNERVFQQHGDLPGRGLSVPRMRLLGELAFHGPLRMNELAHEMGVTPRTMTTMVDALDRERLVERRPDPDDRRAVVVALSEAGRALGFDEFTAMMRQTFEEMFTPLDETERCQLYRILVKLTTAWEAEEEPGATLTDAEESGGRLRGRARGRLRAGMDGEAAGQRDRRYGRLRFSRESPVEPAERPEPASPVEERPRPRGRRRREDAE